ncbi:elongin-C isoform X2 [Trichoplusia ni]|uniref:Elongin-C n=1 Tax=Trichoplusia ni TaxID=7111 RepID=A0A7E5VIV0_TRINI|nr:elongin-C isoform X2 [Trichoplusia ni]
MSEQQVGSAPASAAASATSVADEQRSGSVGVSGGGSAIGSGGSEEKLYGGCEGPNAMYVKLISSDGHEFIVKREHALTSGTIKAMLSGPGQFAENEANEVNFREIPSHVLQKVCMYFTYKVRYTNSSTEIPEFPIAPEIALELLMAANFLDC